MEKFVKTELAISGKSDYEEIKSIRQKYAHFGMKIAYSVAKKIFKEENDVDHLSCRGHAIPEGHLDLRRIENPLSGGDHPVYCRVPGKSGMEEDESGWKSPGASG